MKLSLAAWDLALEAIKNNKYTLRQLDLVGLGLNDNHIESLALTLQKNKYITSVNLSCNLIQARGAQILASNTTLKNLNVSSNPIGAAGTQALIHNKKLENISVSWDQIGDLSKIKKCSGNLTITSLHLRSSEINIENEATRSKVFLEKILGPYQHRLTLISSFLMGTHPKAGATSPLLDFSKDPMFDKNLCPLIFSFLGHHTASAFNNTKKLKTTIEAPEKLEKTKKRKREAT